MEKETPRGRTQSKSDPRPQTDDPRSSSSSTHSSSSSSSDVFVPPWLVPTVGYLSARFSWVPPNLAWSKLKPAIRCSVVAWISLILFVIPKVQSVMGQASFLILIAVILSPPSDPFLSVLERELLILIFACTAWAWVCLGLFLANLARRVHNPTATIFQVVDGRYIEAAPSVIVGIFIFFGSAGLVGFKAKQGPGPYLVPCILACLVINIGLTTGVLFPFPFYTIGQSILIPLSIHSALSLIGSLIIFPSTLSALFTTRLSDTLTPVLTTLSAHTALLSTPLTSPSFPPSLAALRASTKQCEGTLVPLAAARRLLHNDIILARFAPGDFVAFQGMLRRFAGRADGLSVFFSLVDPARERFPGTSAGTAVNTPVGTPRVGLSRATSRAPSVERVKTHDTAGEGADEMIPLTPISPSTSKRSIRSQPILASTHSMPIVDQASGAGSSSPHGKNSHSTLHSHLHLHLVSSSASSPSPAPALPPVLSHSTSHTCQLPSPSQSQFQSHHPHHTHSHSHSHSHHHSAFHHSLLTLSLSRARAHAKKHEYAVGTFESQRYLNLEATTLWDPMEEEWNNRVGGLLAQSCQPLLEACTLGMSSVKDWLSTVRDSRLLEVFFSPSPDLDPSTLPTNTNDTGNSNLNVDSNSNSIPNLNSSSPNNPSNTKSFPSPSPSPSPSNPPPLKKSLLDYLSPRALRESYALSLKTRQDRIKRLKEVRKGVGRVLDEFRRVGRHAVLEPYKHVFDHNEYEHDRHGGLHAHEHEHEVGSGRMDYIGDEDDHFDKDSPLNETKEKDKEREGERERGKEKTPAHRYLFNCYVYQYNMLQIASIVLEMLDEIIRLEESRMHCRLWTPAERVFSWSPWLIADNIEHIGDDDDPDVIQGLRSANPETANLNTNSNEMHGNPPPANSNTISDTPPIPSTRTGPAFPIDNASSTDLGLPKRRDPDALPPHNIIEWLMVHSYRIIAGFGSDAVLFAVKAGLLTVTLSLPSLIKASAPFAYDNRFIWGIFMGQLTIARFRGETVFGISARIISTFFGAIVGMVMWYISCGSGNGNPFGLAAVCAVCFPFIFFARIYWPIPPMRNIVFFVTIILVLGYSYQDVHLALPGTPGVGWPVAWKRFVLVTAGVVSAFIASFFPPTTTLRLYQRRLLATTSNELGTIYCAILSFANTKHEAEIQEIISSLIAVRNKLTKSAGLVDNIAYEFSFKGRWPADRYRKIAELQVGISFALSHLMSVLEHLEPAWSRAFLRRTRFIDPGFQGDVLAVISMISSSLRTGNPLPQITPCPLIDRFMLKYHGLDVIHKDAEEDYGLPRTLSMDTLRDEQYLMFSVGISTAFGIINRLDRLMIAVKEIVGEQYHIHGVGFARAQVPGDYYPGGRSAANWGVFGGGGSGAAGNENQEGGVGVELGPRTNTVHFDPPV